MEIIQVEKDSKLSLDELLKDKADNRFYTLLHYGHRGILSVCVIFKSTTLNSYFMSESIHFKDSSDIPDLLERVMKVLLEKITVEQLNEHLNASNPKINRSIVINVPYNKPPEVVR